MHDLLISIRLTLRLATLAHEGRTEHESTACTAEREAVARRMAARVEVSDRSVVPLERLRQVFQLSPTEVAALVLLTGLEVDNRLRSAGVALMNHVARLQPDVALLEAVLYPGSRHLVPVELGVDGHLVRFGLIHVQSITDEVFALRRVRVSDRVLTLLHGSDALGADVARVATLFRAPPAAELVLAGETFDEVGGLLASAVAAGRAGIPYPVLLLTGPEGVGRKTLVATHAARLGMRTLCIKAAALPRGQRELQAFGTALTREAMLNDAMPLLESIERYRGDTGTLDELLFADYQGPIAATAAPMTGKPPAMARGLVPIAVAMPKEADRERLWHRALRGAEPGLARWAAERYTVTPGVIGDAAAAAQAKFDARATAGHGGSISQGDIHEGVRGVLDARLATLGTRIAWRQTWAELVLPDDATLEIREFIARVRHRRRVYEDWGFGRKVAKGLGLSALFSGPPGTGKTMVAGLIAGELGLDLYQIDLAKVVSKWVGETEKNLGELFDAAEAGHAILLFDEADSLFAKRTQVQSSNDRYANLEVNYLLQRMESFAGIVILTTNHETAIDEAFRRRLSLRIDFPVPDADERERLWGALLPAQATVAADIDFGALAGRFEMTGGYIKNAVVRAAFFAADEQCPIAMRHLLRAARAEYQAMGKVISHL